jgi:hypothetical protein
MCRPRAEAARATLKTEQVMLVDGNDDRGIDVGILMRGDHPLQQIRTHVFDADAQGVVFSRQQHPEHDVLSSRGAGRLA